MEYLTTFTCTDRIPDLCSFGVPFMCCIPTYAVQHPATQTVWHAEFYTLIHFPCDDCRDVHKVNSAQ